MGVGKEGNMGKGIGNARIRVGMREMRGIKVEMEVGMWGIRVGM